METFVASCIDCQHTKYETRRPAGLLCPLPVPCRPWEDLSLDFITELPAFRGNTTILVIVDHFFERNPPRHASYSSYGVHGGHPLHGPCRKTPQHATKLSFRLRSSVSQQILAGTFSLEWYQVTVKLCLSSSIRWSNRSPKSGNWTIPSGLRP